MASLPFPGRLTLSGINADDRRYLDELEQGGAILVVSDDEQAFFGVLTREPAVLGDAQLAQLIETEAIPPLERLLDAPTDAPAAWTVWAASLPPGGLVASTLLRFPCGAGWLPHRRQRSVNPARLTGVHTAARSARVAAGPAGPVIQR
jgi:hypothetical protein